MKARGQAAMEYVTTYGWAILIVIIIGVVIWQLGLFDMKSRFSSGYSGFSVLVPIDWSMNSGCTLTVQLANGAGEDLSDLNVVGGGACTNDNPLPPGEYSICTKALSGCGGAGNYYEENFAVTYNRSIDGEVFQSAGTLWGNTE